MLQAFTLNADIPLHCHKQNIKRTSVEYERSMPENQVFRSEPDSVRSAKFLLKVYQDLRINL